MRKMSNHTFIRKIYHWFALMLLLFGVFERLIPHSHVVNLDSPLLRLIVCEDDASVPFSDQQVEEIIHGKFYDKESNELSLFPSVLFVKGNIREESMNWAHDIELLSLIIPSSSISVLDLLYYSCKSPPIFLL
ncbi:hypothetical protein K5X82_04075 [Halosquirtibacter xylanolyticus]|uniref:hypothetical protein n=1 Tax=Halosquirtibacter xylanolyticus TaxID=3374599 RepID=UPI00374A1834|nr:hypothetical protein K5X82_04075 [Prolixibacteraceae bacterium]